MGTTADIGPKADSLRRLAAAGLPVPEARFLDTAAYEEHALRAGLDSLLSEGAGTPLNAPEARAAILAAEVDPGVRESLCLWFRELGEGPLAVRSSANSEDLPQASFAGQHGTYFVTTADQLVERVRDCWASLFSDKAVRYREHNGIGHAGVAMAVIVQRLIPADAAGVVFTQDPIDGDDDIWIESCSGIGEALVSGKVTPDRYVLDRGLTVTEVAPGDKRTAVVATPDGVHEIDLPAEASATLSIDEETAREIARLALRAEELLGMPADVEWAVENGRVWLLQARPVTALGRRPSAAVPVAEGSEEPVAIWSNVNTGEILPDVATPMTWSIIHGHADDIFCGMFGALGVRVDAQKLIGLVGGRIYFNLSLVRESFRHIPGFDIDTALGGMHDFVEVPPLVPGTGGAATRASMLRAAVALPAYVVRHSPGKAGRFAADMREKTDRQLAAISARPDAPGALALVQSLNEDFGEFNQALAFMLVAMSGYAILWKLCQMWLGDGTGALANRLVAGQGDVASAEAGHAMWRLGTVVRTTAGVRGPVLRGAGWEDVREQLTIAAGAGDEDAREFLAEWDTFMADHGHHRRGELEFSNPGWAEEPDYVLSLVRGYAAHAERDPMAAYASKARGADEAAAECLARLGPLKRAIFRRVLVWGRASARTRENIKSEAVRWLVAIRKALLLLGERLAERGTLGAADDIFFIEYGELESITGSGGGSDWKALVAARRREYERMKKLAPPPVVVGEWDEGSGPWTVTDAPRVLTGIAVSSGVARGRARVFESADTEEEVLPGEILVAPFTDPGWTPYFVPAAGIVMDMGGLLSHGSIIAREYGIPAVVNVGPATRIISTGQLIEVDGDKGEVRLLD